MATKKRRDRPWFSLLSLINAPEVLV
jgi:hypothetical protein